MGEVEQGGLTAVLPKPLKQVTPGEDPGVYTATGDDPQMLWTVKDRPDLAGRGAVTVTASLEGLDGGLGQPSVYGDWGDGFSEETEKSLALVSPGVYRGVLYSNAGALRRLRFDPSDRPCVFHLKSFVVEPAAEAANPAPRLSPVRRSARAVLRRLPRPAQNRIRRLAAVMRGRSAGGMGQTRPKAWREAYVHAFEVARHMRSPHFAAPPLLPPRRGPEAARVLAFYLPQFHPIPENDAWWGPGFTEWANVSKATPQFTGHLQPRLPADFGYYDLRVPEVRRKQADLARNLGVDAFCFHYYRFGGKRLLEGPLDAFVADQEIELPFALCWANENWTRRWDGQEADVLIGQKHSPADDLGVLDDLATYMREPRYLRIDGRPLILIYRPDALPDAAATVQRWRERAREIGLGELFIVCTNAFGFMDYARHGFDALVEFPPHALSLGEITNRVELLNPGFAGRVYDYEAVVGGRVGDLLGPRDPKILPGVMPAWDNEARKPGAGHVFHNATPELFYRWARAALQAAEKADAPAERLVFVNAWNEWAEGAYLEPDRWFGHAFGQALRTAVEEGAPRLARADGRSDCTPVGGGRSDAVVLLHLYYADLIEEFASRLSGLEGIADLAVSVPDVWTAEEMARAKTAFAVARITPYANRGRDIGPFTAELQWAAAEGYDVFCKIHSKRSPHSATGDVWRDKLLSPLLSDPASVKARFLADPSLGLAASAGARMRLGENGVMYNNLAHLKSLSAKLAFDFDDETAFPSGTMFWGRTQAFRALIEQAPFSFEPELGRIDGGLAHALERAMGAIVTAAGYRVDWTLP